MGVIEGFATFALENEVEESEYDYQIKFMIVVIAIRLLMVYVISRFLWPKIMPAISSSIKSKPGFLNILGLSLILSFL